MSEPGKAYSALATVYDRLGHHDHKAWGEYLTDLLFGMGVPPGGKLIDAACGTGGIALELHRVGFSVLGIDISQQMLTEAAAKAAKAGAPITFEGLGTGLSSFTEPIGTPCTRSAAASISPRSVGRAAISGSWRGYGQRTAGSFSRTDDTS